MHTIAEGMVFELDASGHDFDLSTEILDYKKDETAIKTADGY